MPNLVVLVVATAVLALLYSLITRLTNQQNDSPLLVITIAASVFAVLEALVTLLRQWQESNVRNELKEIISVLSNTSTGMDIPALERETRLPKKILQDRINELILMGRVSIRAQPNANQVYSLVAVLQITPTI